jgi:hypothetical protein
MDVTSLASAARGAIEDGILRYEQDFSRGLADDLESYLPAGDPRLRRLALIELIKVDLELRGAVNPTSTVAVGPGAFFRFF